MPEILKDYKDYMMITKNYSEGTIDLYINYLLEFFQFIKKNQNLKTEVENFTNIIFCNISPLNVMQYITYLNNSKNNSCQTRHGKLNSIKMFYKYLKKKFPEIENPTEELQIPVKRTRLPKVLTREEAEKIQCIFTKENSKTPLRNNTIIALFLSSGIRKNELVNLNIEDVDFTKNVLYIKNPKNRKDRIAYFDSNCALKLKEYLKTIDTSNNELPLFQVNNQRISSKNVFVIVKRAFKLLGKGEEYTVHSLRHTAGTLLYDTTKDILIVKEFLGHESISSTQIYVHINNNKLKEAVDKNPLNKKF